MMAFFSALFADSMAKAVSLHVICGILAALVVSLVKADDPYRYYTWTVTYGTRSPLGVPQQVGNFTFIVLLDIVPYHWLRVKIGKFWFLKIGLWFLKVILINDQFPGPRLEVVTNDNIILNLINKLDQPFLLTWWAFPVYISPVLMLHMILSWKTKCSVYAYVMLTRKILSYSWWVVYKALLPCPGYCAYE